MSFDPKLDLKTNPAPNSHFLAVKAVEYLSSMDDIEEDE
jgi:hypothetical protein